RRPQPVRAHGISLALHRSEHDATHSDRLARDEAAGAGRAPAPAPGAGRDRAEAGRGERLDPPCARPRLDRGPLAPHPRPPPRPPPPRLIGAGGAGAGEVSGRAARVTGAPRLGNGGEIEMSASPAGTSAEPVTVVETQASRVLIGPGARLRVADEIGRL